MDRLPQGPGRWPPDRVPAASLTVPGLVASRVLDAELAALLWITVEANVPLIVAAVDEVAPSRAVLDAFLDLLPPVVERIELQGARETFAWLGDAAALGWTGEGEELSAAGDPHLGPERGPGIALPPRRMAPPETTYLVADEIGADPQAGMSGSRVRLLVRALQRGYGLGATIRADSLEQVLGRLGGPPSAIGADELRRLGVVLVLTRVDMPAGSGVGDRAASVETAPAFDLGAWRVGACHYVRPLERDMAGHLQRRPPAVLATWDRERDQVEHFEWGVTAELAMRVGLARDEFEREHLARSRIVAALVSTGRTSPEALRALLEQSSRPGAGGDA